MGVPGFPAWINTTFSDISKKELPKINNFYIDMNSLIHPQAKFVCDNNPDLINNDENTLEIKIISQCINYLEYIIEIVNPLDTIFIAIDGVAPMAKIKHQRGRRFKFIYDRKVLEHIYYKYNEKIPNIWNTSAITPGTIFMDKLNKTIINWINNKKYNCKIIFSSSDTIGEGEHKILQHIKTLSESYVMIYGLDADLIFLSVSSKKNNIYLMRELEEFSYLSIDKLKIVIVEYINEQIDKKLDENIIIDDFVFLCYLCGNDFIPHIPSLNIKPHNKKIQNGLDIIIDAYINIINNSTIEEDIYILCNNKINFKFLLKIFRMLSLKENEYFSILFNNPKKVYNNSCNLEDEKNDYDNNNINNNNYIYEYYYNHLFDLQLGNQKLSIIKQKENYYNLYFEIYNNSEFNYILEEYVKGLLWTIQYYYNKCPDYTWYYPHHHAPLISDLFEYINNNIEKIENYEKQLNNVELNKYSISSIEQLLLVLPLESHYRLIPKIEIIRENIKKDYYNYFPKNMLDIKIDSINKKKSWQNILMIPIIPIKLLKSFIKLKNNNFIKPYTYEPS